MPDPGNRELGEKNPGALLDLIRAAIMAHRDLHQVYGSTSVCFGGIGGQVITEHCGTVCSNPTHQADIDRWYDVETAFFRMTDGDPEWVEYIPGGRLSSNPKGMTDVKP